MAPIASSVRLLNLCIVLVLPGKFTHRRCKTNHDPCTKGFKLNQKFPHWQWGCGEGGKWLCSLQQCDIISVTFCFSWSEITMKSGLSGELFFQDSDVSFLRPALSLPISEKFTTDFWETRVETCTYLP